MKKLKKPRKPTKPTLSTYNRKTITLVRRLFVPNYDTFKLPMQDILSEFDFNPELSHIDILESMNLYDIEIELDSNVNNASYTHSLTILTDVSIKIKYVDKKAFKEYCKKWDVYRQKVAKYKNDMKQYESSQETDKT